MGVRRPAQCISRPAARLRRKPGSRCSGSTTTTGSSKPKHPGAGSFLLSLLYAYHLTCLRAYHIGGGGRDHTHRHTLTQNHRVMSGRRAKKDIYTYIIPSPPLFPIPQSPRSGKKARSRSGSWATQSRAFGVIVSDHFIHIGENKSFPRSLVVVRHSWTGGWMVCLRLSFLLHAAV
jgi:hypothetical protein